MYYNKYICNFWSHYNKPKENLMKFIKFTELNSPAIWVKLKPIIKKNVKKLHKKTLEFLFLGNVNINYLFENWILRRFNLQTLKYNGFEGFCFVFKCVKKNYNFYLHYS